MVNSLKNYPHSPHQVCKLRRALYDLKQAPRAWFAKFSTIIEGFGFNSSSYDFSLFIRKQDEGTIILLIYVDMIIIGDDTSSILDLKTYLSQHIKMKDLVNSITFWVLRLHPIQMDTFFLRPTMLLILREASCQH